jgi:ATP-dependent Clp protease, protease subunit
MMKTLSFLLTAAALLSSAHADLQLSSKPASPPVTPAAASAKKTAAENPPTKSADPAMAALKTATEKLQAEREQLQAQLALEQSQLEQRLAPRRRTLLEKQLEIEELKIQRDLAESRRHNALDPELEPLRQKSERLELEYSLTKIAAEMDTYQARQEESKLRRQTSALDLQMQLQQKQAEARTYAVGKTPAYPKEPLIEGKKLILSDRTIPLNGAIIAATAHHVAERIAYFHNRDAEAPIFIVIDESPGGSVMAGYKILKAMHGSRAPVYVVVKSFAASMAACITTLAERSFAYPNAIILHHQLSAGLNGNLTKHRENVRELEEWWRRLADPVAKKMGIDREQFVKQMYARTSDGDWHEFADEALKLKWVDVIVDEIEETAQLRHPDTDPSGIKTPLLPQSPHTTASSITLPRLNPLDAYWLYNPDGRYRLQE